MRVSQRLLRAIHAQAMSAGFRITFERWLLAFSRKDHSALFDSYPATLLSGTMGEHLRSRLVIFYERLGPRSAELVATNDPTYARFADYLWKYYQSGSGSGRDQRHAVMHVALGSTLFAAYRSGSRRRPGVVYVLVIWGASIASGWHYAPTAGGCLIACAAAQWAATRQWRPADAAIPAEPAPPPPDISRRASSLQRQLWPADGSARSSTNIGKMAVRAPLTATRPERWTRWPKPLGEDFAAAGSPTSTCRASDCWGWGNRHSAA